jgi:hypothetical protein
MDRTIQLKKFHEDDDEPYEWLEWRNVDRVTFEGIKKLLRKASGDEMNRTGD